MQLYLMCGGVKVTVARIPSIFSQISALPHVRQGQHVTGAEIILER
jgi:hypothetical protein